MPRRNPILITGEFYHVFNRTIASQEVFYNKDCLDRVYDLVDYYRFRQPLKYSFFRQLSNELKQKHLNRIIEHFSPLIELYTSEFMPNHYHFVMKELAENGIRYFVANVQNAFAKYFNEKYSRIGGLFQSPFKAKHLDSEEKLKHVIRYNHLNPITGGIIKNAELSDYPASSFQYYVNSNRAPKRLFKADKTNSRFINTEFVIELFGSAEKYKKFVFDHADYQKKLNEIKKLI